MNQKELKELIEFIIEKGIAEFELERGDVKVKIKRASEAPPSALPDSRYFAVHPRHQERQGDRRSVGLSQAVQRRWRAEEIVQRRRA